MNQGQSICDVNIVQMIQEIENMLIKLENDKLLNYLHIHLIYFQNKKTMPLLFIPKVYP
jgi:hypothetical protein